MSSDALQELLTTAAVPFLAALVGRQARSVPSAIPARLQAKENGSAVPIE